MNTQELISLLSKDAQLPTSTPPVKRFAAALGISLVVCLTLVSVFWGINAELTALMQLPAFWLKQVWLVALTACSWALVQRLSQPAAQTRAPAIAVAITLVAMLALGAMQWMQPGEATRTELWQGVSWTTCAISITVLALPVLGTLLWTLRDLAPTRPHLTGAIAGLLAGAWGGMAYSLHCPETAFTFLALWYGAGLAVVTGLGAVLGGRVLRW
jgi:hypothetical protein